MSALAISGCSGLAANSPTRQRPIDQGDEVPPPRRHAGSDALEAHRRQHAEAEHRQQEEPRRHADEVEAGQPVDQRPQLARWPHRDPRRGEGEHQIDHRVPVSRGPRTAGGRPPDEAGAGAESVRGDRMARALLMAARSSIAGRRRSSRPATDRESRTRWPAPAQAHGAGHRHPDRRGEGDRTHAISRAIAAIVQTARDLGKPLSETPRSDRRGAPAHERRPGKQQRQIAGKEIRVGAGREVLRGKATAPPRESALAMRRSWTGW